MTARRRGMLRKALVLVLCATWLGVLGSAVGVRAEQAFGDGLDGSENGGAEVRVEAGGLYSSLNDVLNATAPSYGQLSPGKTCRRPSPLRSPADPALPSYSLPTASRSPRTARTAASGRHESSFALLRGSFVSRRTKQPKGPDGGGPVIRLGASSLLQYRLFELLTPILLPCPAPGRTPS